MNGPPPGMNPIDWLFEPLRGLFFGEPGWEAAQAEYDRRAALLQQQGINVGGGNPPGGNQPGPGGNAPGNPPGPGPGGNPPGMPGGGNPPVGGGGNPPGPNPPTGSTPPYTQPPQPPTQNPPVQNPPGGSMPPGGGPIWMPGPGGGLVRNPNAPTEPGHGITNPVNPPVSPLPQMLNGFNPVMHITQGIDAGPVWSPEKTQQGVNHIRNAPMNKTVPFLGTHAQGSAQRHLGDVTRQGRDMASLGFSRNAAQANAQQQLQSERARAFAGGLPWMNLTISDLQSDLSDQMRRGGALAQLLTNMV